MFVPIYIMVFLINLELDKTEVFTKKITSLYGLNENNQK